MLCVTFFHHVNGYNLMFLFYILFFIFFIVVSTRNKFHQCYLSIIYKTLLQGILSLHASYCTFRSKYRVFSYFSSKQHLKHLRFLVLVQACYVCAYFQNIVCRNITSWCFKVSLNFRKHLWEYHQQEMHKSYHCGKNIQMTVAMTEH